MDKETSSSKQNLAFEMSAIDVSEDYVDIPLKLSQALKDSKAQLLKFNNLLLALRHKRLKTGETSVPVYSISPWNDILVQAFLEEYLERIDASAREEAGEDESNDAPTKSSGFFCLRTWDELLLNVTEIITTQTELSALLQTEKQTFLPLSPWSDIFEKATNIWNKQIIKRTIAKRHKITLFKWKSRMTPKEYSEFVAGYLYGADEVEKEVQAIKDYKKDLSLDMKIFTATFKRQISDEEIVHKTLEIKTWEEVFMEVVNIVQEGNKLVEVLKKQDAKTHYQVARLHTTWNDCFFKAFEVRKTGLLKEIEENAILEEVASKIKKKMQSGMQEKVLPLKSDELINQGKRMFSIALELREDETKKMKAELSMVMSKKQELRDNTEKASKAINIWQKILYSALDSKRKGIQVTQTGKDQENQPLLWDQLFQTAYDIIAKRFGKSGKIRIQRKRKNDDTVVEYLEDVPFLLNYLV
ncbi:hexokinase_2 domain-containing protein [Caerostris extrusa]|uniref:Hexokinase_2 domain-containing protein n=1 Tax=Caerostris extrusa TaxID=172846 RepID=A0AAV4RTA5_CAEEX|nr:hexokinase_2 domain-containing protein [Caerostris extrusa]